MTVRLNKHIAETGFCSRREADRLIAERRVTVNGQAAGMGAVVGEGDTVLVDGQPLKARTAKAGKRRHRLRLGHRFSSAFMSSKSGRNFRWARSSCPSGQTRKENPGWGVLIFVCRAVMETLMYSVWRRASLFLKQSRTKESAPA